MDEKSLNTRIKDLNQKHDYVKSLSDKVKEREDWELYSIDEIASKFGLDEEDAKKLIRSGLLKVHHDGNDYRIKKVSVEHNIKIIKTINTYRKRKTMSVEDVGYVLGLGRTSSYDLVNKMVFKSYLIFGKIRIDVDSFEEWYASQFRYKKITGERPGAKYRNTLPVMAYAELLGCPKSSINRLINSKRLPCILVDGKRRIDKDDFEKWFQSQSHFKKVKEIEEIECYYD